jgi:hypothetical protein
MDEGVPLNYPIRIVFGSDEETGFRCIEKYKRMHAPPKFTLIFDGTFPFAYSEKHLLNYALHTGMDIDLHGGESYNAVMDHVIWKHDREVVEVSGKSAHASRPTVGENALIKLAYMNPEANGVFKIVNQIFEPRWASSSCRFYRTRRNREETTLCLGMVRNGVLSRGSKGATGYMALEVFTDAFEAYMRSLGIDPHSNGLASRFHHRHDSRFLENRFKMLSGDDGGFGISPLYDRQRHLRQIL